MRPETYQWVLIRGIISEEFHWGDFVPLMKAHFKKDLVSTADILGNGKTYRQNTPLTIAENIEGLRKQVASKYTAKSAGKSYAKNSRKKILVGFSLGGMMALEWAHRYPNEVAGVVLINTSLSSSQFYKRFRPLSLAKFVVAGRPKNDSMKEQLILKLTTNLPKAQILKLAVQWRVRSQKYPVRAQNFLRQLLIGAQVHQRANPPAAPILILVSEKDKIVHPDCSRKIGKLWKLPLVTHRKAGHDLALDDPQWILKQMDRWLRILL